jgi:H+/Cl- antiporter ClcA
VTDPATPTPPAAAAPAAAPPSDPVSLLRTRSYLTLLVLAAVIGAPISAVAYFYLKFVAVAQTFVFQTLPKDWMNSVPAWWPILPLVLAGLIVGLTLRYLHGTGGHKPAEGFKAAGGVDPADLPGIIVASLATLCLGAVLGPEAPLIAIGGGLGVLAVHLVKKDAPAMAVMVIGAAGSFAAIATLLGSPIVGAFLLMEAAGLGGPLLGVVLVPGLLAAGIGSLIFVGLDTWSGYGTFSLNIGPIPHFGSPTGAEFLWAIGIGIVTAILGAVIKRGALALQPVVERRKVLLTPVLGLVVAVLAIVFFEITGKPTSYVLFSGQSALPTLVQHAATFSAGALVALVLCKGAAYGVSLSGFRGGPIFPGMFVGAALGIAVSHLPGLPMIAGVGMGIGAMTVAMLGLPLVSVLLPSLLLASDGVALMPLIIVAVVVSYVVSAHLAAPPAEAATAPSAPAPAPATP